MFFIHNHLTIFEIPLTSKTLQGWEAIENVFCLKLYDKIQTSLIFQSLPEIIVNCIIIALIFCKFSVKLSLMLRTHHMAQMVGDFHVYDLRAFM